jgi:ATP-binding protein involved in chromosome partitioning
VPLLGKVPLTMPLREQADAGTPLIVTDADDPASIAIRQAARGFIAMAPLDLPMVAAPEPVLPVTQVAPSGASLPMAG